MNLRLKMVSIEKGNRRYFEYAGKVVGHMGQLQMAGIKVNDVATTGTITLQHTKDLQKGKAKNK